jgi:hypothetical protein
MGERRNAYRVLKGNPEGMRPLCRMKHGWDYNIKIDFKKME